MPSRRRSDGASPESGGVTVLGREVVEVPVEAVTSHPRNPNVGNLEVLVESMRTNGFYGALIVQRSTGHILAGNHRWRAARELGMTTVPVIYVDVDDTRALRILLADNRTAELAHRDPAQLLALLDEVHASADGLAGIGFGIADLEDLRGAVHAPALDRLDVPRAEDHAPAGTGGVVISVRVPAEVAERYTALLETCDGDTDADRFAALLDRVS